MSDMRAEAADALRKSRLAVSPLQADDGSSAAVKLSGLTFNLDDADIRRVEAARTLTRLALSGQTS